MFGRNAAESAWTSTQTQRLREAVGRLGLSMPKVRKGEAEFAGRAEPRVASIEQVTRVLDASSSPTVASFELAGLLDLSPPVEAFASLAELKDCLRPRLLHPREMTGVRRSMCRRETFDELLHAIAVGGSPRAPLVTTAVLDRWGVDFDTAAQIARDNLAARLGPQNFHEVSDAPGLIALIHDHEQAASGAFVLDHLFPSEFARHGVVFSTPREDVLLALPVTEEGGPDALAAMVRATFAMAHEEGELLSEHIHWWRNGSYIYLPMTAVEEGRSRRIHVEAKGPLEDLLRILGAIE